MDFSLTRRAPKFWDLARSLGRVRILQTPQCCSFVHILVCFTAQNRSYTLMPEHFMNLKSFIWNWSLKDFFYLPGLLAIPFKFLNENKEGQSCHISRFQWTPQHLRVWSTDLNTGTLEDSSSESSMVQGKVPPVDWPWWWCLLDGIEGDLIQQSCLFHPLS